MKAPSREGANACALHDCRASTVMRGRLHQLAVSLNGFLSGKWRSYDPATDICSDSVQFCHPFSTSYGQVLNRSDFTLKGDRSQTNECLVGGSGALILTSPTAFLQSLSHPLFLPFP